MTKTEGGEQVSISSKCTELDHVIPEQLGVSRAILENVIFCHQEDSLWPLSEPAVLKKKFDDIFASTRYSKALDAIKSVKKNQSVQIKIHSNDVEHLKFNKDKADEVCISLPSITILKDTLKDLERRIEEANQRRQEIEERKITAVTAEIRKREIELQEIQAIRSNISKLDSERSNVERNLQEYREVTLMEESTAELFTMIEEKNNAFGQIDGRSKDFENQIKLQEDDLKRKEGRMLEFLQTKGKLQSELENILRKTRDKQTLIGNIRVFLSANATSAVRASLSNVSDDLVPSLLQKSIAETSKLMKEFKSKHEEREKELTGRENNTKSTVDSAKNLYTMLQGQISDKERKILELRRRRQKISVSDSDLEVMKEKLESEEDKLMRLQMEADDDSKRNSIVEIDSHLQRLEAKRRTVSENLRILHTQAQTKISLDMKRAELEKMQTKFDDFSQEDKLAPRRSELEKFKTDLSKLEGKVEVLNVALEEKESHHRQLTIENASKIFTQYISIFEERNLCPLCLRGFTSQAASEAFLQKLLVTLEKMPPAEANAQAKKEKEELRNKLMKLKPVWNDMTRLMEVEIPAILEDKGRTQIEVERLKQQIPTIVDEVNAAQSELDRWRARLKQLDEAQGYYKNAEMIRIEILSLESELFGNTAEGSTSDLQQELDAISEQRSVILYWYNLIRFSMLLNRRKEELTNLCRQAEDRAKDQTMAVAAVRSQLRELETSLAEVQRLESGKTELEAEICSLRAKMGNSREQASALEPEILEIQAQLKVLRDEKSAKEAEHSVRMQKAQHLFTNYSSIVSDLERASRSDPEGSLTNCESEIAAINNDMKGIRAEVNALREKVSAISEKHSELSLSIRNIQDNIKIRQLADEKKILDRKILKLRNDLAMIDSGDIEEKLKKATSMYERYCNELKGEVNQMQLQATKTRTEIEKDYNDATKKYINKLALVKAETLASEDLEKYAKALENLKMEEINKIIRELWVNTYKGNDIDTIEIRSDQENLKGNRSYNYRVIMLKENVEMDMRGRCSAGQKVLAALIIRLALAETFCLNCGILALDEPTTNLDRCISAK
ncbi:DNA repair protein rad50 [Phlyctochytrium bullatum]|nr:DNA repair protein rad50 [Phlyctochytrium bullatum]